MYTSLACAWSGALLLFGGTSAIMWVFNRSLSLHLQICWSRIPGKKSFYAAQLVGWGIPATVVGVSLGVSGVAYRFGDICHINHDNSLAAFWIPTLFFASLGAILQFATLGYVCRVYLRNLWDPKSNSTASSAMKSAPIELTNNSLQSKSIRSTYRRVMKVLALQWRGIVVVMIVLISTVYFAVIFNIFDRLGTAALKDADKTKAWVVCIVLHNGDKSKCLDTASGFSLNETVVSAVLVLLSLMGYWCILFLGRISMFIGWWELMKKPFLSKDNFVSVDARRISDPRNYEMLSSPPQAYHLTKSAKGGLVATAKPMHLHTVPISAYNKELLYSNDSPTEPLVDYQLPLATRNYQGRERSFSQPRVPGRSVSSRQRVVFEEDSPPIWQSQLPNPVASSIQHINEYTPRENNPHTTRPPSTMSNSNTIGRSSSALGRDWPTPSPRQTSHSPTPYQSNSQNGANSALSSRALAREWDPTSTFAR